MREKIIRAAAEEIEDIGLYKKEAGLFRDKVVGGGRIDAVFEQFAAEEMLHLEAVKELIPDVSFPSPSAPKQENSLRKVLHSHVERELGSIRLYEEILKDGLPPARALMVKGIISDETGHMQTVIHYLKLLEQKSK